MSKKDWSLSKPQSLGQRFQAHLGGGSPFRQGKPKAQVEQERLERKERERLVQERIKAKRLAVDSAIQLFENLLAREVVYSFDNFTIWDQALDKWKNCARASGLYSLVEFHHYEPTIETVSHLEFSIGMYTAEIGEIVHQFRIRIDNASQKSVDWDSYL